MFNITGGELLLVLLLGLLVLGPQRLPQAARTVGKVMAQVRDLSNSFQREFKDAFDDPGEPVVKPTRPQLTALEGGAGQPVRDPIDAPTASDPIESLELVHPLQPIEPTDPVEPVRSSDDGEAPSQPPAASGGA